MAKNHSSSRGTWALNLFALVFTLLPIVTMSLWTHQMFFSDDRQVVALSRVESDAQPRLFEEPLISVTFDDGWESVYSEAAPIMSRYDIVSTQYILPGEFNRPIYLSVDQAQSLKRAGHEISSHTYTHQKLTDASERTVRNQLDDSLEVLRKFDLLDENQLTFAAPNGALAGYSLDQVKQRFSLARNVKADLANDISDNDMNVAGKTSRYDVIGYTVGQYTTLDQMRAAIDYAHQHNAWFVPIYHQVDESGAEYGISPAEFERHMQLFRESGIKISTVRDVYLHNQEKLR